MTEKTSIPVGLRLLGLSIHVAHITWVLALIASISKEGAIVSYSMFVPPLVLASCLEMWRWVLVGREVVEIKGRFSRSSEIDKANRDFLSFSWYVFPPIPPFKLLERYSANLPEVHVPIQRSLLFAKFWLKSEMTLPMMVLALLFISVLYTGSPPEIFGLGKFYPVACFFWVIGFGPVSKLLSVFIFSISVRLHKGV